MTLEALWAAAGGEPGELERVRLVPDGPGLPTVFRVAELASASVAATLIAADGLRADRDGEPAPVTVGVAESVAAFASERHLRVDGKPVGDLWAPLSGDYPSADGWVRLHCNFAHHAAAVARALGCAEDVDAVRAAVSARTASEVERAVLAEGGAAAAMGTREAWFGSAAGAAAASGPLITVDALGSGAGWAGTSDDPARPLRGLRVLELTRIIAGPVAGRVLAALGAEVIHVRGPHLPTIAAADADTGFGKRAVLLDARADRELLRRLAGGADVVLSSYRPGALAGLGLGPDDLATLRPGVVVADISAYGPAGPWAGRRGFDSLVQMSAGIADEGMRSAGADRPVPLPMQALDHATGWLTALGVLQALRSGGARRVRTSLARTASWLDGMGRDQPGPGQAVAVPLRTMPSAAGPVTYVAMPGRIGARALDWPTPPAPAVAAPPDLDW